MEWDTKLPERATEEILFKLRIKYKLLSVLEYEDSFIEVHKIISKLKSQ